MTDLTNAGRLRLIADLLDGIDADMAISINAWTVTVQPMSDPAVVTAVAARLDGCAGPAWEARDRSAGWPWQWVARGTYGGVPVEVFTLATDAEREAARLDGDPHVIAHVPGLDEVLAPYVPPFVAAPNGGRE